MLSQFLTLKTLILYEKFQEILMSYSLLIRQKGESQSGVNKKTKYAKFSDKKYFLQTGMHTYVGVSGSKKCSFSSKIWCAWFSCYFCFEIRLFALLRKRLLIYWPTDMLTEAVSYDPFFLKEGMQNKDENMESRQQIKKCKTGFSRCFCWSKTLRNDGVKFCVLNKDLKYKFNYNSFRYVNP